MSSPRPLGLSTEARPDHSPYIATWLKVLERRYASRVVFTTRNEAIANGIAARVFRSNLLTLAEARSLLRQVGRDGFTSQRRRPVRTRV
jgi:hypothetical protein